jgi:NodT family efflux transporter outer membrane factor (OMF) lipoprotein
MKTHPLLNLLAAVALAASAVLALASCASSSGIGSSAQLIAPTSVGLDASAAPVPMLASDWWRGFDDAGLNELISRALAANPSLAVAQARLARALAAVAGTQAADGPQINGSVDVSRQYFSANSIYPPPLGGAGWAMGEAQIAGSWEFDFFGRNRAAIESAVGTQRAAAADVQAARLLLASQVARSYVQLGRLLEQRALATRSLQQRDEMLALIKQRVQQGLDTTIELRLGEGALPELRQQIEQLDEQITLNRHALAALTAQAPDKLDALTAPLRAVTTLALPDKLPANLLGRRADIAAARWRVEAASSDMDSAKAKFYPNINLRGFVGLASIGMDRLVKSRSEEYGVGPAVSLPIFDSGRLRANLSGKAAELDAAVASYNAAVLDAVRDAADQISSLHAIERQQQQQRQAQAAAESAYALSLQRYQAGLSTYLVVLSAETSVLGQRRQAADLLARTLDTQIALMRSLGGGYAASEKLASASTPLTP